MLNKNENKYGKLAVYRQKDVDNHKGPTKTVLELKEKVCKIVKHKTTLQKSVTLPNTSKLPEKETKYEFSCRDATKKKPSVTNFIKI